MKIVIGQEAICPDGLGRVRSVKHWAGKPYIVKIDTYINNRCCEWSIDNIELINPRNSSSVTTNSEKLANRPECYYQVAAYFLDELETHYERTVFKFATRREAEMAQQLLSNNENVELVKPEKVWTFAEWRKEFHHKLKL